MKISRISIIFVSLFLFPLGASAGGDVAAGKEKSVTCVPCHGEDGNSTDPTFPKLAGQHADYIVQALKDYKSGKRNNGIMIGFSNLSDQDMEDLGAYFAAQDSVLHTPTNY